jgi:F-type H+-transporting ATPase subunit b
MAELIHDPEFWVTVAFILAIALVVYLRVGDTVKKALDERAEKIRAELDEARRLREEAQQMLAEYQRKQRDALTEAEEIASRAREEAERIGAQGRRDLEAAIDRRRQMAEEKIAQAEAKALAEIRSAAVDVAMAATRQILTKQLDERRRSELIDQAIQALPGRLH